MNTGATVSTVALTYNIPNALSGTVTHEVPAGKRYAVFTNAYVGSNLEFSMHVHSYAPVVCEACQVHRL